MYDSKENKKCYFPPLLSNGDISFAPDAEGMLGYTAADYEKKDMVTFDGIVVRAGRRSAVCNTLQARLFPMGKFTFSQTDALKDWRQGLRVEEGTVESECFYENGDRILSRCFIHPSLNLYALEKEFHPQKGSSSYAYDVNLSGYCEDIDRYMSVLYAEKRGRACHIGFRMYGMEVFTGEICVFVDRDYTVTPLSHGVRLSFSASEGEKVVFYYYLADDLNGTDFAAALAEIEQNIEEKKFSGLLSECVSHYKSFFDLGYVKTADASLDRIYKTSLYAIKCNTTSGSIAVGFNNKAWDGKYFAFDEFSAYLGLLGANRHALAKRVPSYRLRSCLPRAIQRASDCHRTERTEDMARFHWESGEYGNLELAPDGNWIDHVFHIPLVGIGAFLYYEYTGDEAFLRECYPMIRACAKFFTRHMLYRDGEKLYIGKCTDLERLGSSVENPFMTACGAIKLLECCHKAARILQTDGEYAQECAAVARGLYENLPVEEQRYVPHLGCEQKSIAVFAGKYPFNVLSDTDEKMLRAWEDFEENGAAYGNMYPTGKGISPWYACWKAEGYARVKMRERAYETLKQAYPSAGVFDELFEINEDHCRRRLPWFSTAAGIFVSTVNDMLVDSDGETVWIMPGMPHHVDVSFCLAAKGGIVAEAEVKNGALRRVRLLQNGKDVTDRFKIEF